MDKIRVLMIDDNINLVNMVREYFSDNERIEISLCCYDGEEGINCIINEIDRYDLILLDLIMPKRDGMYVLDEIKKRGIEKNVIVESSYNTADVIRKVSEYGADYYILKPFELTDLESKILDVFKDNESGSINLFHNNMELSITKILHDLGMPSHVKGYQYVREGVCLLYERPEYIGGITKYLYPEIANRYDTTTTRVERAIRHAIEISWNRGDWDLMEELFGNSIDIDKSKPTNSEFLVTLSDKLRLEYMKRQIGVYK